MLSLNIAGVLNAREIQNHNQYLCQHGFSPFMVSRWLNHKTKSISNQNLERLCLLLHCTPNDLYVYSSTPNSFKTTNQPLYNLKPLTVKTPVAQLLNQLSVEQFKEVRDAFDEILKNMEQEKHP